MRTGQCAVRDPLFPGNRLVALLTKAIIDELLMRRLRQFRSKQSLQKSLRETADSTTDRTGSGTLTGAAENRAACTTRSRTADRTCRSTSDGASTRRAVALGRCHFRPCQAYSMCRTRLDSFLRAFLLTKQWQVEKFMYQLIIGAKGIGNPHVTWISLLANCSGHSARLIVNPHAGSTAGLR
jgi:hypothetical protein